MNRTWLHLKSITVTFHSFSISYTLCRNWLSVVWFCISCTQHNRHICRVPHKEAGPTVSTASLYHWLFVIWFCISCTWHICWIPHKKVDPTVYGSRILKVVYARYLTERWAPQCVGPAFLWGTRHMPPWSYDLYYFLFSQTEHTPRFFFFFFFLGDQSFKPLHFIDLDNVIHTLKVLSLLLCKCFLCVCVNSEFSVFLCILNLYLICEQFNLNDEKVGQRGGT